MILKPCIHQVFREYLIEKSLVIYLLNLDYVIILLNFLLTKCSIVNDLKKINLIYCKKINDNYRCDTPKNHIISVFLLVVNVIILLIRKLLKLLVKVKYKFVIEKILSKNPDFY